MSESAKPKPVVYPMRIDLEINPWVTNPPARPQDMTQGRATDAQNSAAPPQGVTQGRATDAPTAYWYQRLSLNTVLMVLATIFVVLFLLNNSERIGSWLASTSVPVADDAAIVNSTKKSDRFTGEASDGAPAPVADDAAIADSTIAKSSNGIVRDPALAPDTSLAPAAAVVQADSAPQWFADKCAKAGHPAPTKDSQGIWNCFTPSKITREGNAPVVPGLAEAKTSQEFNAACTRAGYKMTTRYGRPHCDTSRSR